MLDTRRKKCGNELQLTHTKLVIWNGMVIFSWVPKKLVGKKNFLTHSNEITHSTLNIKYFREDKNCHSNSEFHLY